MDTIATFFSAFWPAFLGAFVGLALVWVIKCSRSEGYPPFIGPKTFCELSSFNTDDQKRLLHTAFNKAVRPWQSFIFVVGFAAILGCAAGLSQALPKVTLIPASIWARAAIAAVFFGFGCWLVGCLEARLVRPFLKKEVEGAQAAG